MITFAVRTLQDQIKNIIREVLEQCSATLRTLLETYCGVIENTLV